MTRHAAAKALFKGESATLDLIFEATPVYGANYDVCAGRLSFAKGQTFLSCFDDREPIARGYYPVIDGDDSVEIALGGTHPVAGNVALAAYWDGWAYEAGLILFRDGKDGTEGYIHGQGKWAPLSRFRILGLVTGLKMMSPGGLEVQWRAFSQGLDVAKSVSEIRHYKRWKFASRLLDRDFNPVENMGHIVEALGRDYLPDQARLQGTFAVKISPDGIDGVRASNRQYTTLFFDETANTAARDGLLALIAYEDQGEPTVDVAALVAGEGGELWAQVRYEREPLPPEKFRFLSACVGGENPDGVLFADDQEEDLKVAA